MTSVTCGIDIGSESTKVVLGPTHGCEIVRNEVGGHTTPTAISFSEKTREIGPTANRKGKNALYDVNRLLAGEMEESNDAFEKFYLFDRDEAGVTVEYNGAPRCFQPAAVVAMLLGKVRASVLSTMERISGQSENALDVSYYITVGPNTTEEAQGELLDAAFAAGMESATILGSSLCYSHAFQRKFPEHMDGRIIMIVDMGHSQTTVSVLQLGTTPGDASSEEAEEQTPTARLLASVRHKSLGAGSVDGRLWHHFQSTSPGLQQVTERSRSGQRLLDGSKKLKHLLSQLPEGSVTVENVGQNDTDIKLTASRAALVELCQPEAEALSHLIKDAMTKASVESVSGVEAVGGGCRIPWVQSTILESVGGDLSLSHSLDDTSASLGAALIGSESPGEDLVLRVGGEATDQGKALLEAERTMATLDEDMKARADIMNKLEAHVLEMRSAKHGTHGSLIPDTIDEYLNELDDWIFSDEAAQASKADADEKLNEATQKTHEMCKEYMEAVRKDSEAKERSMEEEAQKAQLERAGEDDDDEDHDNRRLPKKRRMEIVMKNKAEANELFSGGNFKFAAARYTKALSHCAKFVDLSPDDQDEVNGVKLSLNLNLALMYIKLEKPEQALRVCNDALAIDETSTKALYRRASVFYEKKDWEGAYEDVEKAIAAAPDDKAIIKLKERIEAQKKRQKAKEKKMAQKMFG